MDNELIPYKKWLRWAEQIEKTKNKMVKDLLKDIPNGVYYYDGNVMMGSAMYEGVDIRIDNGTILFENDLSSGVYDLDDISLDDTLFILSGMKRKED